MALILVLSSLTILTIMLSEIQDESSAELGSSLSARDAVVAEYAARSAVNLSRLLIASEPTIRKTLSPILMMLSKSAPAQIPVWQYSDRILGAFNDKIGQEAFKSLGAFDLSEAKNLGLPGASFELQIIDEDSKINLNEPARGGAFAQSRLAAQLIGLMGGAQNDTLFERRDNDGNFSDRQAICSALIDWTDPDQDTYVCDPGNATAQSTAAEDSYYQLLKRPYQRKNTAFDSMEEVHRVRGLSDDFWNLFVDPDPDDPTRRTVTVWGQGAINVNTANPQTLLAFACASAPTAEICTQPLETAKFLGFMSMLRMLNIPIFGAPKDFIKLLKTGTLNFAGMSGVPGSPGAPGAESFPKVVFLSESEALKMVTVESKLFSIYATGVVKAGKRETRVRVHAVVDFRNAPAPGTGGIAAALSNASQAQNRASNPSGADEAAPSTNDPAAALQALMRPSPSGTIIHYKVE